MLLNLPHKTFFSCWPYTASQPSSIHLSAIRLWITCRWFAACCSFLNFTLSWRTLPLAGMLSPQPQLPRLLVLRGLLGERGVCSSHTPSAPPSWYLGSAANPIIQSFLQVHRFSWALHCVTVAFPPYEVNTFSLFNPNTALSLQVSPGSLQSFWVLLQLNASFLGGSSRSGQQQHLLSLWAQDGLYS